MIELQNLLQAMAAHDARPVGPVFARSFAAFSHDSRTVAPGELFVALRTDKADGHAFIGDAILRGATGVLCERDWNGDGAATIGGAAVTVIRVADTRAALIDWARFVLNAVHPYRMAVTGAAGKSTTAAALCRVLRSAAGAATIFSNGNRNDELGLPLALGELRMEHEVAIVELAGDSAAELHRLSMLLRPELLIVTTAGLAGAEDAATSALRDGLPGLLAALAPNGVVVANGDDGDLAALLAGHGRSDLRTLHYGLGGTASGGALDIVGTVLASSTAGTRLRIDHGVESAACRLKAPGMGAVYAGLAAVAAAIGSGLALSDAVARLDGLPPQAGRLAPLAGTGGRIVLDDTFNAGAASLALALATLDLFAAPRAAVLGEISGVAHTAMLPKAAIRRLLALDLLVLQGKEMAALGRELRTHSRNPERIVLTYSARDSADAVASLPAPASKSGVAPPQPQPSNEARSEQSALLDKDALSGNVLAGSVGTILVKGSDLARMERVVELLLPPDQRALTTLVRQGEGWRRRSYVPNERPTWVEVDLDAIRHNLKTLQQAAAPAQVMAVLKADAYGHGARWVARTAALNGAAMLGVASLNEALDLRADGITTPILILGYAPPWQARQLALSDIRATVFSLPVAEHFSRVAADLGRRITVHVKVDTGMTRLGVLPADVSAFVDRVAALPGVVMEGIFSHMATSDSDVPFAEAQGDAFAAVLAELDRAGHRFRYTHMENSAAAMRQLPYAGNLVRIGLALYGLYPLPPCETDLPLRPALSFKTRVAQVKCVPTGTTVSYGRTFRTTRPSRIAVLPVGYGDGFRRAPANWGAVLVRGQRAPIAGTVCMDMTMIDVTDVDGVQEGDEVVLIGRQGDAQISAEDVAAALGTISYEVVTQILPRVPRQTG